MLELNTRIKLKRDTAANWEQFTTPLLDGEIAVVDIDNGNTRIKIGDGTATYNQLDFSDLGAVQYAEQTLTDEQKTQARENIGAVSSWNDLEDKPFGTETVLETIIPLTSVSYSEDIEYDFGWPIYVDNGLVTGPAFEADEVYVVTFDGEVSECVTEWADEGGYFIPFAYSSGSKLASICCEDNTYVIYVPDYTTHTLKIEKKTTQTTLIDDSYIPDTILRAEALPAAVEDALTQAKESGEFDGAQGPAGADGYTPVRGTDYWTDEDKTEIKTYVDEAILGGAW